MKPEILNRIALRKRLLSRMTLGFAAGALTVLTFPPFSLLLLVPVAYSALFVGLRGLSFGRAFLVGWAFGLGQFGFGISWIAESFYVETERFGAMAIPAVAGLSAGLAIFPAIAAALPDGRVLLTGVPDRVPSEDGTRYFNTVQAFGATGRILTGYAKHHLVPFGEYVPFRGWLPIERLTAGLGDFAPGPGPRTLSLPGVPLVAVAICYEIIFPGHVVDDLFRPDWIFNATNDAWFGTSIGPEQHLASARMRAVEEGLPVIRAANTGISAVIDANGEIVARLDTGERGIIDAGLPSARPPTLYAGFGDWMLLALILAS